MSSEDRVAITEVLYRYARAVDRKDFESLRRCYFLTPSTTTGAISARSTV